MSIIVLHGMAGDSHVVVRQQADFARVVACCRFCDIDNDIIKGTASNNLSENASDFVMQCLLLI